ncbi:nucleotidyltransferase domain-containing protein [Clostridium isatidis]|uniref:nucleotidyltransferase domain-containing protein n=1 Tax=Clostridium isatidis TaxID=182773 RepID=UPI0017AA9508|nr:nucleotidyltransferase domain-containing protein [Clostridiales bacterium]
MVINNILNKITAEIENIPGIVGIVLGGSRARGNNHETSDIDIGIYYDEALGFSTDELSKAATKLDDEHRENLVTPIGGWGPWVNAGGWLVIDGYHVDFILRDIDRVEKEINDCIEGKISTNYQTGHPHGYLNVMYMGEISICKILSDKYKKLTELKNKTNPYPKRLKDVMVNYFMFEACFSLMHAESNIYKDDISYVAGHIFRSVSCLNQLLFTANEEYCINEKKAVKMVDSFEIKPENYKKRIDKIYSLISSNPEETRKAVEMLKEIIDEVDTDPRIEYLLH